MDNYAFRMRLFESTSMLERSCTAYLTGGPVFTICLNVFRSYVTETGEFTPEQLRQFDLETQQRYQATKILYHESPMGTVFIIDYLNDHPMPCS